MTHTHIFTAQTLVAVLVLGALFWGLRKWRGPPPPPPDAPPQDTPQ